MISYAFIHLMLLIVGKGNWIVDYFKKQQRILEGCLGMLSSKHSKYMAAVWNQYSVFYSLIEGTCLIIISLYWFWWAETHVAYITKSVILVLQMEDLDPFHVVHSSSKAVYKWRISIYFILGSLHQTEKLWMFFCGKNTASWFTV